ncbi:MAG: ABC transporter permease [Verrucomicrobiota bacterium]|nr:MAG: ABC transporter permease [Verrucomicrobiota bacterium]
MWTFVLRRVLFSIPIFIAVTFLTFSLIHAIPGGPFDSEREMAPVIRQRLEEKYGLDRPLWEQYGKYMQQLAHGDFGPSYKYTDWSVAELMQSKVKVSFELGAYGMLFALFFGILGGILGVHFEGRWPDQWIRFLTTFGLCLPAFIIGPLLIYLFGIKLRWFDVAGWETWPQKILPMITVGLSYAAYIAQLARHGLGEAMHQSYILAARARGIPESRILWVHALRNGLLPVVAYLGSAFSGIISGAIITETVFQIPGLGRLFIQAITNRDGMLILGIVNFCALAVIVCNTVSDCLQAWLNPKIRLK